MSIGVLLITHDQIGQALVNTATSMLGMCPLPLQVISVRREDEPDDILVRARSAALELGSGTNGVLVLTDMYGSTPSNIAGALCEIDGNITVIAGVNLPMLVRVLNYPRLTLRELADKAVNGGRDGIFECCNERT